MRSRTVAIIAGVISGILLLVCLFLGIRFWGAYRLRQYFPRAVELYSEGDLSAALGPLEKAIDVTPEKLPPVRLAAVICVKLEEFEQARKYYGRILELAEGAEKAQAHLQLGAIALRTDGEQADLDEAVRHLEAAAEGFSEAGDGSGRARALLLLAHVHKRLGDESEAKAVYDQVAALPAKVRRGEVDRLLARAQIGEKLRSGEPADVVEAWHMFRRAAPAGLSKELSDAVSLALAFQAANPNLSAAERKLALQAIDRLPPDVRKAHEFQLHLIAAIAFDRLGKHAQAVARARAAHQLDRSDPRAMRTLVDALFATAEEPRRSPHEKKQLREEGLQLCRSLLESGSLSKEERRKLTLALATRAWNSGERGKAGKQLDALGDADAPAVERVQALAALKEGDYQALAQRLNRVKQLDPPAPDATALLKQLSTPPEVTNFRVNRLYRYDRRPILIASFAPRAAPVEIARDSVKMTLGERAVEPVVTRGECFFRPAEDLSPGEHSVTVEATDALGLTGSGRFNFRIETDTEPPTIVGIQPAPGAEVGTGSPVIAFRCTDPSGIAPSTMQVTFTLRVGTPARPRDIPIIRDGVYQLEISGNKVKVPKGTRVGPGMVRFQSSKMLPGGPCKVRVVVEDSVGNRCARDWEFRIFR
jgi:tetratricopeptide (TPR) repeat protein